MHLDDSKFQFGLSFVSDVVIDSVGCVRVNHISLREFLKAIVVKELLKMDETSRLN